MKYVTPKYELTVPKVEDIILSAQKYEIEENDDGSGNVIISTTDLF